jgi:hypothetical protein
VNQALRYWGPDLLIIGDVVGASSVFKH